MCIVVRLLSPKNGCVVSLMLRLMSFDCLPCLAQEPGSPRDMIYVPAGEFVMGTSEAEAKRLAHEHHVHPTLFLRGQWLALVAFSAGAFNLRYREQFIGWTPEQRRRRLPFGMPLFVVASRHDRPNTFPY